VARPQRLNETQIAELFDPPTGQRDLVRHFTLSEADLGAIRRCRGDHNRLGYALMLCYLRHPGRALRSGERPPPALLAFVAEQIGILPDAAERNRQRHAVECQEQLGLRPFGKRAAVELASALLQQAIEDDRLARLAELVMETCRQHRIVVPSPAALERLCAELRHQARREVYRRLTNGLAAEQRRRLDALTQRREETNQNWLTWLRQMPEAAKPGAMLGLIERLEHVRAIGIEPGRGHLVHQARVALLAREAGLLPDVTIDNGVLKIAPIEKSTPPEAEALTGRLYAMLPRIRITDLLAEVAGWTLFPDCFTHLRTGEAADGRTLMAGLLADGLNLGLTRMAEACSIASLGQLAWTADWHIREETYALALRCLVNQQQREPFAAIFGSGTASSSDGQFFQASGFGRAASRLNAHYGQQSGFKVYTHLSDRYGPFFTKLIAATASEALHVLDALLYHQSEVSIRRHHTDGGGDSDHVFALCALLGFQFAPRIPGLKHRRLYSFSRPSDYPTLEPLIAGRINVALIRAHWSEILRIIASLRTGAVTASLIMRQLASYPRQNGVATALRELGRLQRTLFTLDWIEDPELRRTTGLELNKGEARNSLARAVFIHRLGEIRDRTYENQQHRASGLNLLVTAIILWNTRYLERAVATLRQTEDLPDHLLAHLSPLGWEHVNLTGDYVWGAENALSKNNDGLRPLRTPPTDFPRAA
jgi:TnpA family transposase